MRHANGIFSALYYIVISGLSGSTIYLRIFSKTAPFSEKMLMNMKCVFWSPVQFLSKQVSFKEEFGEVL